MSDILSLRHIHGESHLETAHHLIVQAIELYIQIFREPPYEEDFAFEDVHKEFTEYILNGCFLLGLINDEVVGFMCSSVGLDHVNSSIETDLISNGIDYQNDIYISELGVSKNHRGKKIAKKLINKFMEIHPTQNMFLRTGVYNNDHVIRLYEKYDFIVTPVREFVVNKRANGEEEEDERLYMFKKQAVSCGESKDDDGYPSGAEYLYGTSGHYDGEENHNDENDDYKSGSEYLY